MDPTCTEKIYEMKINQPWVFHVQNDRESTYTSTYIAMSYFIGMANREKERVFKGNRMGKKKVKLRVFLMQYDMLHMSRYMVTLCHSAHEKPIIDLSSFHI